MKKILYTTVLIFCLFAGTAQATTWRANSCENKPGQLDVQNKINEAQQNGADGDTVEVPAGVCTWETGVTVLSGTSIILKGDGIGITIIRRFSGLNVQTPSLRFEYDGGKYSEITGFTFDQGHIVVSNGFVRPVQVAAGSGPSGFGNFRFHHNHIINIGGGNGSRGMVFQSAGHQQAFLVDSNYFHGAVTGSTSLNAIRIASCSSWDAGLSDIDHITDPLDLGSPMQAYIENNVFEFKRPSESSAEGYGCARVVFRFNKSMGIDQGWHGPEGDPGTVSVQSYRNQQLTTGMTSSDGTINCPNDGPFINECNRGQVHGIRGGQAIRIYDNVYAIHKQGMRYYAARTNCGTGDNGYDADGGTNVNNDGFPVGTNVIPEDGNFAGRTVDGFAYPDNGPNPATCPPELNNLTWPARGYPLAGSAGYQWNCLAWGPPPSPGDGGGTPGAWGGCLDSEIIRSPAYSWGNRRYNAACPNAPFGEAICGTLDANIQLSAGVKSGWFQSDHDYFNEDVSFTGDGGVGVGPIASRPVTPSLEYVGWYATDMGGNWDCTDAAGDLNDGLFYRYINGAWVADQAPLQYPHPLTGIECNSPPATPTALNCVGGAQLVNCTWDADAVTTETGFVLERGLASNCSDCSPIATPGIDVEAYQDTGLQHNTTYYYKIKAVNNVDSSAYSNIDSATTDSAPDIDDELCSEEFESGSDTTIDCEILTVPDGATIVVLVGMVGAETVSGIADGQSNVYEALTSPCSSGTNHVQAWIARNVSGGDFTITATFAGAVTNRGLSALAITGLGNNPQLDDIACASN